MHRNFSSPMCVQNFYTLSSLVADPDTRDWTDGLLSNIFRDINKPLAAGHENDRFENSQLATPSEIIFSNTKLEICILECEKFTTTV